MAEKVVFLGYPFHLAEIREAVSAVVQGHAVPKCADDELTDLHLLSKIQEMMLGANVCLFDLTTHNVNVAVEYGLARGLNLSPLILYCESPDVRYKSKTDTPDVFSDLRGMDSLRYRDFDQLKEMLASHLPGLLQRPKHRVSVGEPRLQMRLDGRALPNGTASLVGVIFNAGTAAANRVKVALAGYLVPTPRRHNDPVRIGTIVPGEPPHEVVLRYDDLSMISQPAWMEHVLVEYTNDQGQRFEQRGKLPARKDVSGRFSYAFEGLDAPKEIDLFSLPVQGLENP